MIDLFREAFKDEYILCEEVLNTTIEQFKKSYMSAIKNI